MGVITAIRGPDHTDEYALGERMRSVKPVTPDPTNATEGHVVVWEGTDSRAGEGYAPAVGRERRPGRSRQALEA
jgi:hypothetical protein